MHVVDGPRCRVAFSSVPAPTNILLCLFHSLIALCMLYRSCTMYVKIITKVIHIQFTGQKHCLLCYDLGNMSGRYSHRAMWRQGPNMHQIPRGTAYKKIWIHKFWMPVNMSELLASVCRMLALLQLFPPSDVRSWIGGAILWHEWTLNLRSAKQLWRGDGEGGSRGSDVWCALCIVRSCKE